MLVKVVNTVIVVVSIISVVVVVVFTGSVMSVIRALDVVLVVFVKSVVVEIVVFVRDCVVKAVVVEVPGKRKKSNLKWLLEWIGFYLVKDDIEYATGKTPSYVSNMSVVTILLIVAGVQ